MFIGMDFMDSNVCAQAVVHLTETSYGNVVLGTGLQADKVTDNGGYNMVTVRGKASTQPTTYGVQFQPGTAGVLGNGEYSVATKATPYVALGDGIIVAPPETVGGCLFCGYNNGTNSTKIIVANRTGSSVSFSAGKTWRMKRLPVAESSFAATVNPGTVNAGAYWTTTVTLPGVVLGDLVVPGPAAPLNGLFYTCHVTADNTVTIALSNFTAGNITVASSIWSFFWFPKHTANYTVTKDPGLLNNGDGETLAISLLYRAFDGNFLQGTLETDNLGVHLCSYVTSTYNGAIRLENETGVSSKNIASSIARIWVWKQEDNWRK